LTSPVRRAGKWNYSRIARFSGVESEATSRVAS
jgi:hypothetical protein